MEYSIQGKLLRYGLSVITAAATVILCILLLDVLRMGLRISKNLPVVFIITFLFVPTGGLGVAGLIAFPYVFRKYSKQGILLEKFFLTTGIISFSTIIIAFIRIVITGLSMNLNRAGTGQMLGSAAYLFLYFYCAACVILLVLFLIFRRKRIMKYKS